MIKAIIFDCFGVLTATELWKEFIASLPKNLQKAASDLNRAHDANLISLQEFNDQIVLLTGRTPDVIETRTYEAVRKNEPLFALIENLHPSYKMAILSNIGSNWVRDVFLNKEEQKLFDEIVLSYEVRATKPSPEIYHIVADKLGCEPQECVFIDDGEHNCEGARAVGMTAIHYDHFAQCKTELERLLASDRS